ncbi:MULTISPECIES: hypothetical protein [Lysinibacillus]|jgi:SOS response regulatory protein OraA/RecX|uniref:hypothetical protein n=1 Tax=Lysinibacillus TaxID=400634 RepID=UPI0004D6E269|nr:MULTISPECIES: hypothetical protein [Lysinibacillus]AJK86560.1 hypothetical protein HR49_04790 [Lysinibacillus fusiformis]KHK51458.1 hypothetical protein PI85_13875 [Lysinibacillus sp. A1]
MRKYYNLEEIHNYIGNGTFENKVLSVFQSNGVDEMIDYLKVSGICLNKNGKNKNKEYLDQIFFELKGLLRDSELEKVVDLENEISLFEELIDKNLQSMNEVMNLSFFQNENLLSNLLIMGQRMADILLSQKLELNSGKYEISIEAFSKVLWYVLFVKKARMTSEFEYYESIDNHMEMIISNSTIDFQLGNWIDDWQFASTKIFKDKKKKKIKIRISEEKLKVDIAKNRYLTTLDAKMSRQAFESLNKKFSTLIEVYRDLYLNYDNDIEFIKQFLNINDPSHIVDKTIGISLEELCQTYFCLKELAFDYINKFKEPMELGNASFECNLPIYSFEEIRNLLCSKGIEREKIEKLIKLITFSKKSNSIFENPLIQMDKGNYTIIPQIVLTTNITSSIMRLMSNESILSEKGYGYEKAMRNLVEKGNNLTFLTNIKDNTGCETYELDGAFYMGETLYLCEIKNFSHVINSFEYYKLRYKVEKAFIQMKRNFDFYTSEENLNKLSKRLNLDKGNIKNIRGIIIVAPFLGENINKNEITVIEGILTRNFFNQTYPKVAELSLGYIKSYTTIECFKVFEKNGLTDKNFNMFIEESPYIKYERQRFKKGFKTYKPWNVSIEFNILKQQNVSFKKYK